MGGFFLLFGWVLPDPPSGIWGMIRWPKCGGPGHVPKQPQHDPMRVGVGVPVGTQWVARQIDTPSTRGYPIGSLDDGGHDDGVD
ncbi:hypothetical protein EBZ35_05345 [bacterium]|nr:hypothetical protein [bacterium]